MSSTIKFQKGSTLLETVIYIFIFLLLTFAVITTLYSMSRAYGKVRSSVALENSAQAAMERMSREIRDSASIDNAGGNLADGILSLNTYDNTGNAETVRFAVVNQILRVYENGQDKGPLTSNRARVTNLAFNSIITSSSTAIRVSLTLESGSGDTYKSQIFRTTEVLRGSYTP